MAANEKYFLARLIEIQIIEESHERKGGEGHARQESRKILQ